MQKRGETVMNFVLMIGLILVSVIVIANLNKITIWQGHETEKDFASVFADTVAGTIEKAINYPSDSKYEIIVPFAEEYNLTVSQNIVTVNFPRAGTQAGRQFYHGNINILPSFVENAGRLRVYLDSNNLLVASSVECRTNDMACDPGCVIERICDSRCYSSGADGVCNPYCVDIRKDLKIDDRDADSICDPDCMIANGICDPDCRAVAPGDPDCA